MCVILQFGRDWGEIKLFLIECLNIKKQVVFDVIFLIGGYQDLVLERINENYVDLNFFYYFIGYV